MHGREIGVTLGFPTANISTHNKLIPPDGVYAVMAALGGHCFQGACNIGTSPTFGVKERTIEVFLFDFSDDIYDREIDICFVQRLREEKKYPDARALIQAVTKDVTEARTILTSIHQSFINPLRCQQSGHF